MIQTIQRANPQARTPIQEVYALLDVVAAQNYLKGVTEEPSEPKPAGGDLKKIDTIEELELGIVKLDALRSSLQLRLLALKKKPKAREKRKPKAQAHAVAYRLDRAWFQEATNPKATQRQLITAINHIDYLVQRLATTLHLFKKQQQQCSGSLTSPIPCFTDPYFLPPTLSLKVPTVQEVSQKVLEAQKRAEQNNKNRT